MEKRAKLSLNYHLLLPVASVLTAVSQQPPTPSSSVALRWYTSLPIPTVSSIVSSSVWGWGDGGKSGLVNLGGFKLRITVMNSVVSA